MSEKKLSANEGIKTRSNYLRGTIAEGLADLSTGSLSEDDQQLIKFHGSYQQDDRDLRPDRRKHRLEKLIRSCSAFACPVACPPRTSGLRPIAWPMPMRTARSS
nr:hypothetical protein [Verrucomicrobium spinosum]